MADVERPAGETPATWPETLGEIHGQRARLLRDGRQPLYVVMDGDSFLDVATVFAENINAGYSALVPWPDGCSGWRLCHTILGMSENAYLEAFDRVNLLRGDWHRHHARDAADRLKLLRPALRPAGREGC